MYTLTFDANNEQDQIRFEVCLHGLLIAGNRLVAQKGMTILKREMSLLDKLEAISRECNCGKQVPYTHETDRVLLEDMQHTVDLTPPEYDLLINYIGMVPWGTGTPARRMFATLDWLVALGTPPRG